MGVLKMTPWFGGNKKPKRIGVYQRDYGSRHLPGDLVYSMWNGKEWLSYGDSPDAAESRKYASVDQDADWRGLASPPEEK